MLEVLFGFDDGVVGVRGCADEVVGRDNVFVGMRDAGCFDGGEEGVELGVFRLGGLAEDENSVERGEDGQVMARLVSMKDVDVWLEGEGGALEDG